MLNILLVTCYLLLVTFITWRKFHHGIFLLFLLLPTYLIRFHIGPLPTTLLEMMIWIILVIWLIKYNKKIILNLKSYFLNHKSLFISICAFLLATTISIFTSVDIRAALGEWKAFYIEPFLIFLLIITTTNEQSSKNSKQKHQNKLQVTSYKLQKTKIVNSILSALIISGLVTSMFAIYQHFTGFLVPHAFWANGDSYRVTAWYGFPNGVGLFLAPLVPIATYLIKINFEEFKKRMLNVEYRILIKSKKGYIQNSIFYILFVSYILYLISAPFAVIFAKSTGGLIGMLAGIGLLLLIYKKTRWITVVVCIIGILSLFSFSGLSSLKNEVLFQDRSGQVRLSIYQETWEFLKDNPILGAGLASYSKKIEPYHTTVNGEGIEIFHHPHNIFLTMWVNLGLLGLFGFLILLVTSYRLLVTKNRSKLNIFILASLATIIVTGLVDSPYIKNDLSIFFWTIIALTIISQTQRLDTKKIK